MNLLSEACEKVLKDHDLYTFQYDRDVNAVRVADKESMTKFIVTRSIHVTDLCVILSVGSWRYAEGITTGRRQLQAEFRELMNLQERE